MERISWVVLGFWLLVAGTAGAAPVANGDFETGDFTGWSLDTDGAVGGAPDFHVVGGPGAYSARIGFDHWIVPGDLSSAPVDLSFFANTLYQGLDLTTPAGFDLYLSFEWQFSGEGSAPDEAFTVGLNDGLGNLYGADGNLGFLLQETAYSGGANTFSAKLSPSFANQTGWFLDFQLGGGLDGFGSEVLLDNVALEARNDTNPVPEPGTLLLLGTGVAALVGARRKRP